MREPGGPVVADVVFCVVVSCEGVDHGSEDDGREEKGEDVGKAGEKMEVAFDLLKVLGCEAGGNIGL